MRTIRLSRASQLIVGQLIVAILFGMPAPAKQHTATQEEGGASLKQTLTWIKSKFDSRLDRWDNLQEVLTVANPCTIEILRSVDIPPQGTPNHHVEFRTLLPLSDIDPRSVKVEGTDGDNDSTRENAACARGGCIANADPPGTFRVSVQTNDGKRTIVDEGKFTDHADVTGFNSKSQELAPRIESAFRHAVTLCGGTAEPF